MPSVRFLQFSDLHLDSSLTSGRLGFSPEKVRIRQQEIRSVLGAACQLATERAVDLVLVPGDLFDDESVSLDTVNFVIDHFGRLDPIPVVIAPGNHDFYSLGSPYNSELLTARRQRPWPPNVKIFTSARWEIWNPPGLPAVSITGMAHAAGTPLSDRLVAAGVPRDASAPLQILVFHGSRDNTDLPSGKLRTLPFSDAELTAQGFAYAAIGHYHESANVAEPGGRIVGAYAGCPAGRGLDETGPKSVIVGDLSAEEGGLRLSLERVKLDRRTIHVVEVPCTGLTHREAMLTRAEELVALRSAAPEDILFLRLTGRVSPGIDLRFPDAYLGDRFFHVAIDTSRLRPAYDLDRYRRAELRTTEARFAREMLARLEASADPTERRIIENALFYGLDALIQKEVAPRYEE